jgi:hypothetical protein
MFEHHSLNECANMQKIKILVQNPEARGKIDGQCGSADSKEWSKLGGFSLF